MSLVTGAIFTRMAQRISRRPTQKGHIVPNAAAARPEATYAVGRHGR